MTKHFCDRCHKETDWRDMVRVYFNDANTGNSAYPDLELCKTCAKEVVAKINSYTREARFLV